MAFSGFTPRSFGKQDCTDKQVTGTPSTIYSYIAKFNRDDIDDVDLDIEISPCDQLYHSTAQIDDLQVNNDITIAGDCGTASVTDFLGKSLTVSGTVSANTGTFSVKPFVIDHPTKDDMKLVHACLEGPENGVYIRGRLKGSNTIVLPEYWTKLVDAESISVQLTQIGYSQDLIVQDIQWGKNVIIKSGNGTTIDCYYTITGTRKDVAPLPVEMGQNDKWPYND
jgi:hypothetical protein